MSDPATLNLIILGYMVGLPVLLYGVFDLMRIPARLYHFTPYSRRIWMIAIAAGYACFGVGAILMVAVWFRSPERRDLREDLALDARWERPATRTIRRRERARRHRRAAIAVSLPIALGVAATFTRVG